MAHNHKIESVHVTDDFRLLWDFPIQTDHQMEYNRPDIVCENKIDKPCLLIDKSHALLIQELREEKRKVYQDLQTEIKRLWKLREVNFENWLKRIQIECSTELLKKACLLAV